MQLLAEILPELKAAHAKDTRSQEQLAIACGCSQGQISRILSGKIKNMRGNAYRLCKELGISLERSADFDLESHLVKIESVGDSRQRELVGVIRHALSRLNAPAGTSGAANLP